MTLLVAGILLGIGVPNVMEFQRNGAMTRDANDLVTGLLTARTEAVKRQVPVTLCLSDDPTADPPTCSAAAVVNSNARASSFGSTRTATSTRSARPISTDASDGNAVVDAGETVLMRGIAIDPDSTLRLSANCGYVAFGPNGWTRAATGAPCATTFVDGPQFMLYCDDRGRRPAAGSLSSARAIRIDPTGRGVVLTETAQVEHRDRRDRRRHLPVRSRREVMMRSTRSTPSAASA